VTDLTDKQADDLIEAYREKLEQRGRIFTVGTIAITILVTAILFLAIRTLTQYDGWHGFSIALAGGGLLALGAWLGYDFGKEVTIGRVEE
jgi:hypothetical protein